MKLFDILNFLIGQGLNDIIIEVRSYDHRAPIVLDVDDLTMAQLNRRVRMYSVIMRQPDIASKPTLVLSIHSFK